MRELGHDVLTAAALGMSTATDTEHLRAAHESGRIFVTRDRDFGGLVFAIGQTNGVLYLRTLPSTLDAVHTELERVLRLYTESQLADLFMVVEPARHRVRRLDAGKTDR